VTSLTFDLTVTSSKFMCSQKYCVTLEVIIAVCHMNTMQCHLLKGTDKQMDGHAAYGTVCACLQ